MRISILCILLSLLSLAMIIPTPAAAASFSLNIFGNANMDDTIDEKDIDYIESVIKGTNEATNLSDANYDGTVDQKDIDQIRLIIQNDEECLTLIDTAGRTVTLKMPIKRIVAVTGDAAEAIRVLHATDKVVGVSVDTLDDATYLPDFSKMPNVGKWSEPDIEKILTLQPDLAISYKSAAPKYLEPKLNGTGIPIVALDLYRADDLPAEMKMLGYILGKTDYADRYLKFFYNITDAVQEKTSKLPADKKARVYLEGYADLKTYTKGKGGDLACTMAGGVNLASDLEGAYPEVESEWVMIQNPDVIVRLTSPSEIACGYATDDSSGFASKRKEILDRTGWSNITAVKDDRVYMLLYEFGASPAVPVTIAYMAKWFYPDLFPDLDPKALHQQYLNMQDFDYDLNSRGVFAYPS
ncbi:MAG: Cobalamin-binding protein precursor [Methanosaeta sp. PtaU1.Bin112]|nr:MAG: Cobalamin-binding protein precursor [Methanosaeta sp. PtaU1.Bin112]